VARFLEKVKEANPNRLAHAFQLVDVAANFQAVNVFRPKHDHPKRLAVVTFHRIMKKQWKPYVAR